MENNTAPHLHDKKIQYLMQVTKDTLHIHGAACQKQTFPGTKPIQKNKM